VTVLSRFAFVTVVAVAFVTVCRRSRL